MKVRINNNRPNSAQRKALRQECVKEFDKLLELYNKQVALAEMQIKNIDRYDIVDEEIPDICEIQLRNSGIDIKKILEG